MVAVALRGPGPTSTAFALRSGTAWLRAGDGRVVQLDGTTADRLTTVDVVADATVDGTPQPATIVQAGASAIVTAGGTSQVVDGATWKPSDVVTLDGGRAPSVLAAGSVVWAIVADKTRVMVLDPDRLVPQSEGLVVGGRVLDAEVTADGTIWLLTDAGELRSFAPSSMPEPARPSISVPPGSDHQLVIVDDTPVLVTAEPAAFRVDVEHAQLGPRLRLPIGDRTAMVLGGATSDLPWLMAVDRRHATVTVVDVVSGATLATTTLPAGTGRSFGAPIEAHGHVFVPDTRNGSVAVVKPGSSPRDLILPITEPATARLELIVHQQRVFWNNAAGDEAGVITEDLTVRPVSKTDADGKADSVGGDPVPIPTPTPGGSTDPPSTVALPIPTGRTTSTTRPATTTSPSTTTASTTTTTTPPPRRIDGPLSAWGRNFGGALGTGGPVGDDAYERAPVEVRTEDRWIAVAAGSNRSLALRSDGTLWAWGTKNWSGDVEAPITPAQVGSLGGWTAIATGGGVDLALRSDGTLWAWGTNLWGQLGDGAEDAPVPKQIGRDTDWTAISSGGHHSLALKSDGTLWAWGQNTNGRLGIGDAADHRTPTRVGAGTGWAAIDAGLASNLAVKADGTLWAWGAFASEISTPMQVGAATDWSSVALGLDDTGLALKADGTLWAIGAALQPEPIDVDHRWRAIASDGHQLAIRSDGTMWAWGDNTHGQLGTGDTVNRTQPTQVGSGTTWFAVAAGDAHSLALHA